MKRETRLDPWRLTTWAAALAALGGLASLLARMPWTDGHDNWVHSEHALALWRILQVKPALAPLFLDKIAAYWLPLTYFATDLLLFVRRSIWAFHATTLLFAAVFLTFLIACLRRLSARPALQALGLFAVLANQQWIVVFSAYNLEPALNAGIVFVVWALLARADGWSPLRNAAIGLLCGLALLTKLVILAYLAVPLAMVFALEWPRSKGDPRARRALLAFLAATLLPLLVWRLPRLPALVGFLLQDTYGLRTTAAQPWRYYLGLLLLPFAGAPLWLLTALAARRIDWPKTWRAARLPLLAAVGGLAFFSAIGTKRLWYVFGVHTLLVLVAVAALDRAADWAKKAGTALALLYAALAVLLWVPGAERAYRWLSLGGDDAIARELAARDFRAGYRAEESAAASVLETFCRRSAFAVASLGFQDELRVFDVEKIVAFRRPDFALIRGLYPSFHRELEREPLQRIDHACFATALEQPGAHGLSWEALRFDLGPDAAFRSPETLRAKLGAVRAGWREVARSAVPGGALAIYENERQCLAWPEPAPPDIALLADFFLNCASDARALARAADLLFAAAPPAAEPDHVELLAHHLIGQAAPNSPLVHILADRLALRLLDAGRGEEAASLVRDLSPAHDFGQALTQRGAELLRRGQYARAAWVYRTMIVTRVDLSGESYERLAECYRGLGRRDDEAETIARALIALLPEQPVSQRVFPRLLELEAGAADAERLGRVYAAWLAAGRQDYEDARLLLREVLRAQLKAGRAARLAALLDDPRIAPASRDMLGELADEAGRRQDWDAALLARRRLVARSPDDLQATRGLIEALKQTGRFAEEAEAIARALQQLPPQSVDAARLLQRLFALEAGGLAAGEYEAAARQTLGDARRSPAARAAAFKRLLRLLLDRGRDNEANALLAGAAEEWDPDGALETLAADYLAGGRCDLATRVAQKGLARNPLDESAFRRVLQCLPRAGEAGAQALAPLEQALAVDSAAYRSRVDELYRAGSSGPFEEWAQRLLAATPPQDPGRLDVVEKLLAVYAASGRPGEALALAARETGLRNASAAPALLWAMADFAYVQRLPGVDDALLAQAERGEELGESCRRVATARRALIAQSPTSPRFAMRNAAVRPGSLASWRAWAGVNFGRGRADAATRALVNATAPWSDDFQTCHDAVAIARARGLSIDGQTAEALAALREVCCDPDMKTIARGMEASWRAAGSGGKDK